MEINYCCPACNQELIKAENAFVCTRCHKTYPVQNGIPILIDETKSLFLISDFVSNQDDAPKQQPRGLKASLINFIWFLQRKAPANTLNLKAKKNYAAFAKMLMEKTRNPKVLVIGGRTLGMGMEEIVKLPIDFVETDVAFGPNTKVICDAHYLPFPENYFDGVIIQAVIEYLVDPYQCVAEIHRVLKNDMPVYAETPFIQQVHGREFDFTRFTHLGHRRLFRNFEEIDSGACVGTGTALAWSYKYFLLSFANTKIIREFLLLFAAWTGFVFKYFDYLTINKAATLDAASGYYFLGRKSNATLSDKELIKQYRGMV